MTQKNDMDEPPLDPAVERIRKKLALLLFGSMGIMVLGVFSIFVVIAFRLGAFSEGDDAFDVHATLPRDAKVIETSIGDKQLAVRIALPDGSQEVRLYRVPGGEYTGRIGFVSE